MSSKVFTVIVNPTQHLFLQPVLHRFVPGSQLSSRPPSKHLYMVSRVATRHSVTVTPSATTVYTATGTSSAGCIGTSTVLVTYVPNPTSYGQCLPTAICRLAHFATLYRKWSHNLLVEYWRHINYCGGFSNKYFSLHSNWYGLGCKKHCNGAGGCESVACSYSLPLLRPCARAVHQH